MAPTKRIGIIGCGAKALAVGVKAEALFRAGCPTTPFIDIFERTSSAGALWKSDDSGYSDGSPLICTSFARDLGFPYPNFWHPDLAEDEQTSFHLKSMRRNILENGDWRKSDSEIWPGVSSIVMAEFSTIAWIRSGIDPTSSPGPPFSPTNLTIKKWVDEGLRQLTHAEFGQYLGWVASKLEKSDRVKVAFEVTVSHIDRDRHGRWQIHSDKWKNPKPYDGIVISGNGSIATPPGYTMPTTKIASRCQDMKSFWVSGDQKQIEKLISADHKALQKRNRLNNRNTLYMPKEETDPERVRVAIIGAGGAATAVAARILKMTVPTSIWIIGSPAALYSRSTNPFEEQYYGSNSLWSGLPPEKKIEFLKRLGAGASWSSQIEELTRSGCVNYRSARWTGWTESADGNGLISPMLVAGTRSQPSPLSFHLGINATGYDTLGFIAGLVGETETKSILMKSNNKMSIKNNLAVSSNDIGKFASSSFALTPSSASERKKLSGLHVPDLCPIKGPAATNLMALGWLADSILKDYISNVNF